MGEFSRSDKTWVEGEKERTKQGSALHQRGPSGAPTEACRAGSACIVRTLSAPPCRTGRWLRTWGGHAAGAGVGERCRGALRGLRESQRARHTLGPLGRSCCCPWWPPWLSSAWLPSLSPPDACVPQVFLISWLPWLLGQPFSAGASSRPLIRLCPALHSLGEPIGIAGN